jgi:hypothetical protein
VNRARFLRIHAKSDYFSLHKLTAARPAARSLSPSGYRYSVPGDDADSLPRIRRAPIPDDAWLVVRGLASLEPETSIRQARLFRRRYAAWGRWGLSAFYARSEDEVLDLGEDRLDAFETLFVYRVDDLIEARFEIVPTFRSPHVTIAFYNDLEEGIDRLLEVNHRVLTNPAYRQEEP